MSFRTKRVLIGSLFYALLTFIVLNYLFSLFGGIDKIYTLLIAILLLLMQTVPMFFEEKKSTSIGRLFSRLYGIWQWTLVMLIIYLAVIYIVSTFISIPTIIIATILATIPIIGVYAYYNAHRLVVKKRTLEFENIPEEYNIVQLSDVHFGSIRHKELIHDLKEKLNELSDTCDLAIISGDLADGSCCVEEDDLIELKEVDMPIIFTSGNHDYYPGIENVHKACKKAGMIILENRGMQYGNLNIYGLSYSFGDIPMPSKEELENFIDEDMINIINYHIPNGWKQLSELGFDIQLSGHTHGGQFYPVTFFGNMMYEGHNMGLFKDDLNHYLHVTTGVGCMDFPMRWGTNSELVILKLRKKID